MSYKKVYLDLSYDHQRSSQTDSFNFPDQISQKRVFPLNNRKFDNYRWILQIWISIDSWLRGSLHEILFQAKWKLFNSVSCQSLIIVFIIEIYVHVYMKYPKMKVIGGVFDRNVISFWVVKCYVNTISKWNHTKENIKETYCSNCCCGIRTAIKSVLCQRNRILFISVSNWS